MTLRVWTRVSARKLVRGADHRQHHEALRVLHEHRLADEEVTEVHPDVDMRIEALFEGQLDPETDRDAIRFPRPLFAPSMAPGPPPVITAKPARTRCVGRCGCRLVLRGTRGRPCRAEDADGAGQFGEGAEPFHELRLDPHHPPGIRVHPLRVPLASSRRWSVVPGCTCSPSPDHRSETLLPRSLPLIRHAHDLLPPLLCLVLGKGRSTDMTYGEIPPVGRSSCEMPPARPGHPGVPDGWSPFDRPVLNGRITRRPGYQRPGYR